MKLRMLDSATAVDIEDIVAVTAHDSNSGWSKIFCASRDEYFLVKMRMDIIVKFVQSEIENSVERVIDEP